MADKTATWGIKIDAQSNADQAALGVGDLLKAINSSQDAVKSYGQALRSLRGNSEEVKAGKEKLKIAINAERDAISKATLALGKLGTTQDQAAKQAKNLTTSTTDVKKTFETLAKESGSFGSSLVAALTSPEVAAVALVASIGAVGISIAAATVSLSKFVIESANSLRTMNLFREAATGSATNALHFGHQIEALAEKIPTSREELHKLSISISQALIGARISGDGINDAFNAVGQASAAMGDKVGGQIEEIITRGKMMGRLQLGQFELQGTGISFEGVAKNLAKQMKIGLTDAKNLLVMGRADLSKGTAAIRATVEEQFGDINLRRMLDVNVIIQKVKDNFVALTEDVDLTPILESIRDIGKLFSLDTREGLVLKDIITRFGKELGVSFKGAVPIVKELFVQLEIGVLRAQIKYYQFQTLLNKTFGKGNLTLIGVALIKGALAALGDVLGSVSDAVSFTASGFASLISAGTAVVTVWKSVGEAFLDAYNFVSTLSWADVGNALVAGIAKGITGAIGLVKTAVGSVSDAVKTAFTSAFQIHSPSKLSEGWGRNLGAGLPKGLEEEKNRVQSAVDALVPSAPKSFSSSGGGSNAGSRVGDVTVNFSVQLPNAKDGASVTQALASESFKAQFVKMIEEAVLGLGQPRQAVSGSVS